MSPAESVFLRHEPCPACREHGLDLDGDNLARYSDGHGYCHACGHYEKRKEVKPMHPHRGRDV